jgi:UDP-galactopyranose mutase
MFDYLIVGAGFSGSVLAERLAATGARVCLSDRRPHIGGNAYDHFDDHGVLVHQYGPHIFHTNSERVYRYLSRFTAWRPYEHRVIAHVDGKLVPFPINVDTVNAIYGLSLTEHDILAFYAAQSRPVDKVRSFEDAVISQIGCDLYTKFIRNYTRKQWGLDPAQMDASVAARIPARTNRDPRYFTDRYQVMPLHGYTRMFQRMLASRNITLLLQADFRELRGAITYKQLIYTGPIDEYFEHCHGPLPYRSLRFEWKTLDEPKLVQPVAVINYPNEHAYTRVTEFKHLTGQEHKKSSLVYEYPCAEGEPYYPIPKPENAELYRKYKAMADLTPNVHFLGRLGSYRYYNMDQCVGQALALFDRLTGKRAAVAESSAVAAE